MQQSSFTLPQPTFISQPTFTAPQQMTPGLSYQQPFSLPQPSFLSQTTFTAQQQSFTPQQTFASPSQPTSYQPTFTALPQPTFAAPYQPAPPPQAFFLTQPTFYGSQGPTLPQPTLGSYQAPYTPFIQIPSTPTIQGQPSKIPSGGFTGLIEMGTTDVKIEDKHEKSEGTVVQSSEQAKPTLAFTIDITDPIDQSWTIWDIATKNVPSGWEDLFKSQQYQLLHISKRLAEQERDGKFWFPLKAEMFASFDAVRPEQVEVVILGQDPYPGMFGHLPRATGMAFSQRRQEKVSVSLQNVYKEIAQTVPGFSYPSHGDLTSWARQGVFLLNTCLTISERKDESHLKNSIWELFVVAALHTILAANPKVIFVLWGEYAKKFGAKVKGVSRKLEAAHPSGFSAKGFLGCNHFNQVNRLLGEKGKYIDWNVY